MTGVAGSLGSSRLLSTRWYLGCAKRGASPSEPGSSVESVDMSPLALPRDRWLCVPADWLRRPKLLKSPPPPPPRPCDDDACCCWLPPVALPPVPRPTRIHGIMAARLPRLPEPERRPCDEEGASSATAGAAAGPPPTVVGDDDAADAPETEAGLLSSTCGMPAQPLAASASRLPLEASGATGEAAPPRCHGKGCCQTCSAGCGGGGGGGVCWLAALPVREDMERPSIRSKKPWPMGAARAVPSPLLWDVGKWLWKSQIASSRPVGHCGGGSRPLSNPPLHTAQRTRTRLAIRVIQGPEGPKYAPGGDITPRGRPQQAPAPVCNRCVGSVSRGVAERSIPARAVGGRRAAPDEVRASSTR